EVSTDIPHAEVHILGYYLDYHDPELQEQLLALRNGRIDRAKRILAKLGKLGVNIQLERVIELAGDGSVGRPHIAQALMEKGYITNFREAFTRYIGRDGPAYAERYKLTPEGAVSLIAGKGGLAVLAHPAEHPSIVDLLPPLIEAGLVGMEVYYNGYSQEVVEELLGLAGKYGLIPTGGSDYHGLGTGVESQLGEPPVPLEPVLRLVNLALSRKGIALSSGATSRAVAPGKAR
ncbi:MAG: PHP domain-containing protein, partial [Dehalococcoidia bacterium]|nr:PHP domain-containing protein [Dehalococcoidia bacterium]